MINEVFSIIMPAYNAEETIKLSIESVLAQSEPNFKLYIVNDCSTDSTKEIIKNFIDERIIYIENSSNLGVALSRNKAIESCMGHYICFIDSDDLWHSCKLEEQLVLLTQGWNVVASNYSTFKKSPEYIINCRKSPEIIDYSAMLKSNFIGNLTGVYNAKNLGKFYQKPVGHEDYIMWLEVITASGSAYCVQKNLAYYRLSQKSISSNKLQALKWQWIIYRKILNIPLFKSLCYFLCYIYLGLRKRS